MTLGKMPSTSGNFTLHNCKVGKTVPLEYLHIHYEIVLGMGSKSKQKFHLCSCRPYTHTLKLILYSISNTSVHDKKVSQYGIFHLGQQVGIKVFQDFAAFQVLDFGFSD